MADKWSKLHPLGEGNRGVGAMRYDIQPEPELVEN